MSAGKNTIEPPGSMKLKHRVKYPLLACMAGCCIYNFIAFLKVFVNFRQVPGYRTRDALVRALMEPLYQYREIKTFFEPFGVWVADPDFDLVAVNLLLLLALALYFYNKC
jgi:hypothetical protein